MYGRILLTLGAVSLLAGGLRAQATADDPDARPPVTKGDVEIVKRAREILSSPAVWNRADTRDCPPDAKTFSLYCALEKATTEISANFEHRGAAMQEARFVIDDLAPHANYDHRLMGYNNDPKTTFQDIRKVLDLLQARIEKRLQEEPAGAAPPPPPSMNTELQILQRARAILDSAAKWDRASSQSCQPNARTFGLYCAFYQAEIDVTGKFRASGAAIDGARAVISELAPDRQYSARLVQFNNDPAVSFADIQKLFQLVEERLRKQMAAAAPAK